MRLIQNFYLLSNIVHILLSVCFTQDPSVNRQRNILNVIVLLCSMFSRFATLRNHRNGNLKKKNTTRVKTVRFQVLGFVLIYFLFL